MARSHHADQLKQFYRLRSPSPSAEGDKQDGQFVDYARGEGLLESSGSEDEDEDEEEDSDEEEVVEMGAFKKKAIPGQVAEESDEDDEESDDEDNLNVDLSEGSDDEAASTKSTKVDAESAFPDEQDVQAEEEDEIIDFTRRFAVVNMDWDNMRAIDLYTVFSSMLSSAQQPQGSSRRRADPSAPVPTGKLLKVTIYPSEFGKERMAKEEAEGPAADVFTTPARSEGQRGKGKGKQVELRPGNSKPKGVRRQQPVEEEMDESDFDEDEEAEEYDEDASEGDLDLEEDDELDGGSDADEGLSEADGSIDDVLGRVRYDSEPDDMDSIEGDGEIDMDKLRNYQLERLR